MDFESSLGMRLRGAYLSLHRSLNQEMRRAGTTADQFVVLSLLARDDGLTQEEIGRRCASDASTVGALLRLLEKDELISRKRHLQDGRARSVALTAKGRRLQEKVWGISRDFQKRLGDAVRTKREKKIVLDALERIREAMR